MRYSTDCVSAGGRKAAEMKLGSGTIRFTSKPSCGFRRRGKLNTVLIEAPIQVSFCMLCRNMRITGSIFDGGIVKASDRNKAIAQLYVAWSSRKRIMIHCFSSAIELKSCGSPDC